MRTILGEAYSGAVDGIAGSAGANIVVPDHEVRRSGIRPYRPSESLVVNDSYPSGRELLASSSPWIAWPETGGNPQMV